MQFANEKNKDAEGKGDIYHRRTAPDYAACVKVATEGSLREMIAPAALVIFTPLLVGFCFGKYALSGLLIGGLVSGVQMAISSSNTGGAWDNAKKYIESGQMKKIDESTGQPGQQSLKKHSEKVPCPEHQAAVVGDTVGDPLKDTSGPSLNILVKLMAILSLVFADAVNQCVTLFLTSQPDFCTKLRSQVRRQDLRHPISTYPQISFSTFFLQQRSCTRIDWEGGQALKTNKRLQPETRSVLALFAANGCCYCTVFVLRQ